MVELPDDLSGRNVTLRGASKDLAVEDLLDERLVADALSIGERPKDPEHPLREADAHEVGASFDPTLSLWASSAGCRGLVPPGAILGFALKVVRGRGEFGGRHLGE